MHFSDKNDSTWTVELDIPSLKRVRKHTGIDLVGKTVGDVIDALWHSIDGVEILYWLLQPELASSKIDIDEWYDRCAVDLEPIAMELCFEIRDFFQARGQATMLAAWNKAVAAMESARGSSSTDSLASSA